MNFNKAFSLRLQRDLFVPRLSVDLLLCFLGKQHLELGVDAFDHLSSSAADRLKRAFQLFGVLIRRPTGDVAEGIIRGFNAVTLADRVGNTLCLNFFGVSVLTLFGSNLLVGIDRMELGMGNLMDSGFHCLDFAHAFLNCNTVFRMGEVALCASGNILEGDRNGRFLLESFKKGSVVLHAAG